MNRLLFDKNNSLKSLLSAVITLGYVSSFRDRENLTEKILKKGLLSVKGWFHDFCVLFSSC